MAAVHLEAVAGGPAAQPESVAASWVREVARAHWG